MKTKGNWLDRLLLVPRLRMRLKIVKFDRGFASLHAVECSHEELTQLENIGCSEFEHLGVVTQRRLGTSRSIPSFRVLCIGRKASPHLLPSSIGYETIKMFGQGIWRRDLNAAIVLFTRRNPVRQIVLHEVAHALLDVLTEGFPYPIALQEGYARQVEYLIPDKSGKNEWSRQSSGTGRQYLSDTEYMGVSELLHFDTLHHWKNRDATSFVWMTHLAFWFCTFMARMARDHPKLRLMLRELWQKNIRTPEGAHKWLQETCEMTEDELEQSFHAFCTRRKQDT